MVSNKPKKLKASRKLVFPMCWEHVFKFQMLTLSSSINFVNVFIVFDFIESKNAPHMHLFAPSWI